MKEDLHFFLPPTTPAPFVPEIVGTSYCDSSYRIQRAWSATCVIEYIVSGTGTLIVNGEKHTASEGDVYIIPPKTNHLYYSDSDSPWTKLFINISGTMVASMLEAYGLNTQIVFPHCPLEGTFRELVAIAFSDLPQNIISEQCILKFHEILIHIATHAEPRSSISKEAEQLKTYLDSQMHRTVSVKELAAQSFRSEDFVIKLFKRSYGMTPHAYITKFKLQAAQKLLDESCMPIQEIAASLGYPDPQYFSNLFKKEIGISPRAFRQRKTGHEKGNPTNHQASLFIR